jgi:hypothetical protein
MAGGVARRSGAIDRAPVAAPLAAAGRLLAGQATTRVARAVLWSATAVPFAAVLLFLALQWTWGRSVLYGPDSFGYVQAGLLIDSGGDITGQLGARNIGYPLFAAAVMPFGGFKVLVAAQAVLAAAALASLLWVARRLVRSALAFMLIGLGLAITIVSSDSFVLYSQYLTGDGPFCAALAVTLVLLVEALNQRGPRRAGLLLASVAAAYMTLLFKPNAALALPFCAAVLLVTAALDRRSFLDHRVLAGAMALALMIVGAQVYQKKAQSIDHDFGTRTLYCDHLDVVLPELNSTKPETRNLAAVLTEVRSTPGGWPVMGYNADGCFYGSESYAAIHAAAVAEHMTDRAWMAQQFRRGVLHRPTVYAAKIWHQTLHYFQDPDPEIDSQLAGHMPDSDWPRLRAYSRLIGMDRAEFEVKESSWFATRRHTLPAFGKRVIHLIGRSLLAVTTIATALALMNLALQWRRGAALAAEVNVLTISGFMLAVVLTTAASHSFDVGRYAGTLAPLTFVWWLAGLSYLATLVWRLAHLTAACVAPFSDGRAGV